MIFKQSIKPVTVLDYEVELHVRKMSGPRMNQLFELLGKMATAGKAMAGGNGQAIAVPAGDDGGDGRTLFQAELVTQATFLLACKPDGRDLVDKWEDLSDEPFDALQALLEAGLDHNHLTPESFDKLAGESPETSSRSTGSD